MWETCLQSLMAAVHLCTYSPLVLPCNLKCLPPPLCGTEPVTTSRVVDTASSWFQADPHVYPRPSNTWHHGTVSHTESWSTDQVSYCVSTYCCRICEAAIIMLSWKTAPSHVSQYRAESGNLRKSGSTFHHGTVLQPKVCLYQKGASGMESPKMHSSSRCNNRTYLCGTSNYPVSCKTV